MKKRRSQDWFGGQDRDGFIHRSWMRNQGLPDHLFDGRPVIGIANTFSELTPCNAHFRKIADFVKRGIFEAGGFPLEFPVMSLGETIMRPTTMMFRNLVSMEVEETIRANPLDGVVLLCGCDKTTPSLMMGAASCDLPTLVVSGGPMLNGKFQGKDIGSGTCVWQFSEDVRAGKMSLETFMEAESAMSRSAGHCMTMGTASTMACLVESLGMSLPGNAAIPAVDSRRYVFAHMSGMRIVEMVKEDLVMSKVLTRSSFENAIRTSAAIGGSTNAVVHLIALARRLDVKLNLEDWDQLGREIPCLVNLQPSGKYLMEDFYYAGGLPVVLKELGNLIHGDCITVNGKTLSENISSAECFNRDVIRTMSEPVRRDAGVAVLKGNLAPRGAIIRPSTATGELMKHRGRAVVFENIEDFKARVDSPDLDVNPKDILVLKNCGPKGYPGFPEVGNMPIPAKILKMGITDMVRISDARMSGTAYGTVILHATPEAADGGPLALIKSGDMIELDVPNRTLHLDVSEVELSERKKHWKAPGSGLPRGYFKMYHDHVLQADEGCDFDFLVGKSGTPVMRDCH